MRALCIIGSPKNNGSTAYIVDQIIEGMEECGIETKRYCLGQQKINYCFGCKKCYENGKCVQHDDMDIIIEDLKEADIVVIGTPDYWGDVTGQLKVFFDRNTPYANTNDNRISMQKKRYGISISIREGKTERENISIINSIEHYFGHMEIVPIGRITVTQTSMLDDLITNHQKEIQDAYELGKNVINLMDEETPSSPILTD